jgi:hypothetical protein
MRTTRGHKRTREFYSAAGTEGEDGATPVIRLPPEKRAARFRDGATADVAARILRAMSQRMYLINQEDCSEIGNAMKKYAVLGSTGNVYDVEIAKFPSCSCPDFGRGYLCKHILFVFLKVLKVKETSNKIYQKALLQSELLDIFSRAPQTTASVSANTEVIAAYHKTVLGANCEASAVDVQDTTDDSKPSGDCAICFESMETKQEAVQKCSVCRNYLHKDCLMKWLSKASTCVYCRSEWPDQEKKSGTRRNNEDYVNLGSIQGMRKTRDTSTYRKRPNFWEEDY